jgi:membrane protease YdiL (CAAX protease family)
MATPPPSAMPRTVPFWLPGHPRWNTLWLGVKYGLYLSVLWFVLAYVLNAMKAFDGEPPFMFHILSWQVLRLLVLHPMLEELLFRNVFLRLLEWRLAPHWANVVQAFCFALLHDASAEGPWFYWAFMAGLALGAICQRHRAWGPGVVAHACINAWSLL